MPLFKNQSTRLCYSENNALSMENFRSFLERTTTTLMMLLVSISVVNYILIHFFLFYSPFFF